MASLKPRSNSIQTRLLHHQRKQRRPRRRPNLNPSSTHTGLLPGWKCNFELPAGLDFNSFATEDEIVPVANLISTEEADEHEDSPDYDFSRDCLDAARRGRQEEEPAGPRHARENGCGP